MKKLLLYLLYWLPIPTFGFFVFLYFEKRGRFDMLYPATATWIVYEIALIPLLMFIVMFK